MNGKENIDLLQMFTYYSAPLEDIAPEYRDMFDDDEEYGYVPEYALESFDNAEFQEFASDEFLEYVYELLGNRDYKGFIGFNYNINWRGNSGYKISDDLEGVLFFDYDYSLYLEERGKDIIKLKMYSHDVPTGGDYYIIGIAESEDYYYLSEEASFEEVQDFIEAYVRTFMSNDNLLEEATTNSATMEFDVGKEVENEFSLNGWNIVSAGLMTSAATLASRQIEKAGYKFAGNIGIYGGFMIPVADYEKVYEILADAIADIIENYKSPKTPKAKKWDQSKWDKPRK